MMIIMMTMMKMIIKKWDNYCNNDDSDADNYDGNSDYDDYESDTNTRIKKEKQKNV